MLNFLQFLLPQRFLGIDIGTSHVKLVEISRFGHRRKLENYGSITAEVLYKKPFRTFDKNTLLLSSEDIAKAISAILEEAKIKTKQAVFSIPDFSTFFTSFELPPMTKEELAQAVKYEAKQHIPFPLGEMTLDWRVLDERAFNRKGEKLTILLAAVPNEIINQYREIANLAGLELFALEAEVFGLIRSLIGEDEREPIGIIDIGAQSTTCSIVEKRNLFTSHSFDIASNEITNVISKGFDIDWGEAEEIKKKYGLLADGQMDGQRDIRQVISPLIDNIIREAEGIFSSFYQKKMVEVKKVKIAGGLALLPGLKDYFAERLKKEIIIADPFSNIFSSPILEKTLKEMGPSYAIAVGSALRGLEY